MRLCTACILMQFWLAPFLPLKVIILTGSPVSIYKGGVGGIICLVSENVLLLSRYLLHLVLYILICLLQMCS